MFNKVKIFEDIRSPEHQKYVYIYLLYFIISLVFILSFLYILGNVYKDKVTPEYRFLGNNINLQDKTDVNAYIKKLVNKIDYINFYTVNTENVENVEQINLQDKIKFINLSDEQINQIIFNKHWIYSYEILYKFFINKKNLSIVFGGNLEINTEKIIDDYIKLDSSVARMGEGNATFKVENIKNIIYQKEKIEININKEKLLRSISDSFESGKYINNKFKFEIINPKITIKDIEQNKIEIEKVVNGNLRVNLYYKNQKEYINLNINHDTFTEFLEFKKDINNTFYFAINKTKFTKFIKNSDLSKSEVLPLEPVFTLDKITLKLKNISKEKIGKQINVDKLINILEENLKSDKDDLANLILNIEVELENVIPNKKLSEINPYGVAEILGVGYSSMKNTSAARFTNIKNGIDHLQGLVIMPGEEFSTIKALTPFTKENGYVDGLAIKNKRIVPEIGGGMCQVSTTLFRAAMNSALLITDRSNHSVVVNYYNDVRNGLPGTDATIYEPAPDFKFKNDTKNTILIDTKVFANGDIYMYLWGVSDGRGGEYSSPQIIATSETKEEAIYEASLEVPVGETICSGPFPGMSSVFTYTRTFSDGKIEKVPYYSYYRPQRMNCLSGYRETE